MNNSSKFYLWIYTKYYFVERFCQDCQLRLESSVWARTVTDTVKFIFQLASLCQKYCRIFFLKSLQPHPAGHLPSRCWEQAVDHILMTSGSVVKISFASYLLECTLSSEQESTVFKYCKIICFSDEIWSLAQLALIDANVCNDPQSKYLQTFLYFKYKTL